MKTIFTLFACVFIMGSSSAQTSDLNKFMRKHKKGSENMRVSVPGWLIKVGALAVKKQVKEDPIARAGLRLSNKIKGVKFLYVDNANPTVEEDYQALVLSLKNKHNYDDLISIKSDGTHIFCTGNLTNGKLKNLLFLVKSEEEYVIVSLKTKLKLSEIGDFINTLIKTEKNKSPQKAKEVPTEEEIIRA